MSETTIAFLGQCHTTGYAGVTRADTFPEIAKRTIEIAKPGLVVHVALAPFYHPADLPRALRTALAARPRVIVIEVVGWLSARGRQSVDMSRLPRGTRTAYDRIRLFRGLSAQAGARWPAAAGVVAHIETGVMALVDGPLRALVPRLPRPTVADFEIMLEKVIAIVDTIPGTEIVFQGPAVFNDAVDDRAQAPDTSRIYAQVRDMSRRVALRHGILFVDRYDTGLLPPAVVYQPGTMRPSRGGHEVLGNLLADQLLRAGVV